MQENSKPAIPQDEDRELNAISAILKALSDLDGVAIQRVLDYVLGRLSITRSRLTGSSTPSFYVTTSPASSSEDPVGANAPPPTDRSAANRVPSVRDLKEEKKPTSSNQMAAIVAYYLAEIAEGENRKRAIAASDVEKYFKQAGFKLPKSISQTLPNAAAAGYLDSVGAGLYKLNPVGYNLVAHALPRGVSASGRVAPAKKRKSG